MYDETWALAHAELEERHFLTRVYGWMSLALMLTGGIAMLVAATPPLVETIIDNRLAFHSFLIGEVMLVFILAHWVDRMSSVTAMAIFLSYAALNGVSFSPVFLMFTGESLARTFFVTAGTFGIMSLYGYYTKRDLTTVGNFCGMAVCGLIFVSITNRFLQSTMVSWISTTVGMLIFLFLTAADTQKIKGLNTIGNEGSDGDRKEAVVGALVLYLDLLNIFLDQLLLFGQRK